MSLYYEFLRCALASFGTLGHLAHLYVSGLGSSSWQSGHAAGPPTTHGLVVSFYWQSFSRAVKRGAERSMAAHTVFLFRPSFSRRLRAISSSISRAADSIVCIFPLVGKAEQVGLV